MKDDSSALTMAHPFVSMAMTGQSERKSGAQLSGSNAFLGTPVVIDGNIILV